MEIWNEMNEELLQIMKNGIKGKKLLECANSLADIETSNKREDLFVLAKELYKFSKKALDRTKPSQMTGQDNINSIEEIINRQLTDVLPALLKIALSNVPSLQEKEKEETATKTATLNPGRHTVTFSQVKATDGKDSPSISEREWTEVVRSDLKGSLKTIPVKNATFVNGAATLDFTSKAHMEEAQKTLAAKYEVSAKSHDLKKLDPKLTIFDIDTDVADKEQLLEEILHKNQGINALNTNNSIKVVFYSKEQRQAVIQVSPGIREHIRKNGDHIHLALGHHHVKDRIHVIQCYHCQQFGHMSGSSYCKNKERDPICFYCAGNHRSKDCDNRKGKKVGKIRCSNCAKCRNPADRSAANTHKASDPLCPFYIRERVRVMSRTAGCEQAKNEYLQKIKEERMKYRRD